LKHLCGKKGQKELKVGNELGIAKTLGNDLV
jgi:hypothetical protein